MTFIIAQLDAAPAKELGADLLQKIADYNQVLVREELLPFCIVGSLFALAIVGSGAFASSIAESRVRSRNFHFILGILMPVIYPVGAFVLMSRRKLKRDEEEEMSFETTSSAPVSEPTPAETTGLFDHNYFKELMFDGNGNIRGPFIMRVDDVELRVERIADVLPQVVVIETINADGNQQTMRLPFDRITGCREI